MYIGSDPDRIRTLHTDGYQPKDQLLFCPDCTWQADEPVGMKPICPDCGSRLHMISVGQLRRWQQKHA